MKYILLLIFFACAVIFCANAQTATRAEHRVEEPARRSEVHIDTRPFSRYSVGIDAGTYGAGIWGATNLSRNVILRIGFNYFEWNFTTDLETTMAAYHRGTTTQADEFTVNFGAPRWQMPHGRVMLDWFPIASDFFSITLGAYIGAFDFLVDGQVQNYNAATPLSFNVANATLNPREDGTFNGALRMGNLVKPYVGIGLGRLVPHRRVGFRFDLGVTYQGPLQFISDQATIGNIGEEIHSNYIPEGLEIMSTIAEWARFWPVMNFSLSVRI